MLVTQAEFARLAGKSRSAIKQAIDNRLIISVVERDGRKYIDKERGLEEYGQNSRRQSASNSKPVYKNNPSSHGQAEEIDFFSWGKSNQQTAKTRQDAPQPPSRPSDPPADTEPTETPDYNEERAWHEREKRLIAELERRQKAGELVYKADVEQAQMAVALTLRNQLEALPKQIKQQLPHLSIGDEEMIERLVAKVLTAVADWRMSEEEEE